MRPEKLGGLLATGTPKLPSVAAGAVLPTGLLNPLAPDEYGR